MMNALMTQNNSITEITQIGNAMASSGFFPDVKSAQQAIVKIMAGAELGLPPFAAMTGVHIIKGKASLGANLIATMIKNDPRYNYRVTEHTDEVCSIMFYEDGKEVGVSTFTAEDAKRMGTQNMHKFPKNMLFARAISNGAKWHVPGVFGGAPIYTPDELGAQVEYDNNGEILNVTENKSAETQNIFALPEPEPAAPFTPIPVFIRGKDGNVSGFQTSPVNESGIVSVEFDGKLYNLKIDRVSNATELKNKRKHAHAKGVEKFGKTKWDAQRPLMVSELTGGEYESMNDLTAIELQQLIEWIAVDDQPTLIDQMHDMSDPENIKEMGAYVS